MAMLRRTTILTAAITLWLSSTCVVAWSATTDDATRSLMPPKTSTTRTQRTNSVLLRREESSRARQLKTTTRKSIPQSAKKLSDKSPLSLSVEKGSQYVRELAEELLSQTSRSSSTASYSPAIPEDSAATSYQDLVQEGYVALVQAVSEYENNRKGKGSLDQYVTRQIRLAMTKTLDNTDSRPIGLPPKVVRLLRKARKMRNEMAATPKSTADIAKQLGISPAALERFESASHGTLSMESTLEISDDYSETVVFRDQDRWESKNGDSAWREFFFDDDEQQQQLDSLVPAAEPLRNVIVDKSQISPEDALLETMLQSDMQQLLEETLSKEAAKIMRMRYGIQEKTARSVQEISMMLNKPRKDIDRIEQESMEKLREAFAQRYAETYADGEYQYIEDSV